MRVCIEQRVIYFDCAFMKITLRNVFLICQKTYTFHFISVHFTYWLAMLETFKEKQVPHGWNCFERHTNISIQIDNWFINKLHFHCTLFIFTVANLLVMQIALGYKLFAFVFNWEVCVFRKKKLLDCSRDC